MSLWRNIAKLAVLWPDDATCPDCPSVLPGEDPAFATAVTALGAKLAKADGQAANSEFDVFLQVFQPDPGAKRSVERLYDLARQTTHGYESYARRPAKRYRHCPQILEDVMDGLFFIAAADGRVSLAEEEYLQDVALNLALSPLTFRRIRATHLGQVADDPYLLLQVPVDIDDAGLRTAWRQAIAEAHPDRVRSRGLPQEYVDIAEAKAAALNAAFDQAMRERRELLGVS